MTRGKGHGKDYEPEWTEKFGAHQKARELFDVVVTDMQGSADSICARIEEGYGRLSRAEYVCFLDFARGSAGGRDEG